MRLLKWKCTNECRKLTSEEVELVVRTKSLFQMFIEDLRAGLDGLDSGCWRGGLSHGQCTFTRMYPM